MIRNVAVIFVLAILGCGGGSTQGDAGGGGGGGGDGGGGIDAAHDASHDAPVYDFGCGDTNPCTLSQVCCAMPSGSATTFACVAPGSCPASDKITCDGPDECGGNTPVCCGVDAQDGTGSYPQCGIASLGTSCTSAAACPTHLAQDCSDTYKVTICHVKADCTDPQYDQCCTFGSGSAALTFCIDQSTANLAGAVCH